MQYPLTAFIANNLFYGGPKPHVNPPMIAYPTVSGAFNGIITPLKGALLSNI
jgi:hypothetical protein